MSDPREDCACWVTSGRPPGFDPNAQPCACSMGDKIEEFDRAAEEAGGIIAYLELLDRERGL